MVCAHCEKNYSSSLVLLVAAATPKRHFPTIDENNEAKPCNQQTELDDTKKPITKQTQAEQ